MFVSNELFYLHNRILRYCIDIQLKIFCRKKFVCHHSAFQKPSRDDNKKGLSKNANCPATIKATVKIDTISTRKKDPFIKVE